MYDWYFNFVSHLIRLKQWAVTAVFVLWVGCSCAQNHTISAHTSSFSAAPYPADSLVVDTALPPVKRGLFNWLLAYFAESNKEKKHKKFDFSIIGGPHYSTDTKFGVGIMAAGLYYSDKTDSLMPPSNLALYGDVSTVGYYLVGIKGVHLFPKQRYRLVYNTSFYFFPTKFWGIGYEQGNNSDNESTMSRIEINAKTHFLFRWGKHFYVGPTVSYNWVDARKIERPELLEGDAASSSDVGTGVAFELDTRDVMTNPHKGIYITFSQLCRQQLTNGRHLFFTTDFVANTYRPVWRGCTLAAQLTGTLQWGKLAWNNMAMLGSSQSMRGYYSGRYRDKNKLDAQLELRQHIYRRNGTVVWIGIGTVFPRFDALRFQRLLPNYGIGYRWEFKKNINIRLDYGFGKGNQSGFEFNVNEAF